MLYATSKIALGSRIYGEALDEVTWDLAWISFSFHVLCYECFLLHASHLKVELWPDSTVPIIINACEPSMESIN